MGPTYFDTHSHVNFKAFKEDADAVIARAREAGVWMNVVGSQMDTSQRAVECAKKYAGVYAVVGLHPIHLVDSVVDEEEDHFVTRAEVFDVAAYRQLARSSPKVVGIGECGLDYYRLSTDERLQTMTDVVEHQKSVFRQHVKLAQELDVALMVHTRQSEKSEGSHSTAQGLNAYDDVYQILKSEIRDQKSETPTSDFRFPTSNLRIVMHCFSGTMDHARAFLDLGCTLSFSGIITFKRAEVLHEVVRTTPLEQMCIETDCPYLAPEPYRGKRNEPLYVREVARVIASMKGLPEETVAKATTQNALKLFRIAV